MDAKLNIVPFVSVDHMMKLVNAIGVERFLTDLAAYIEEDFQRWELFDKTPRVASHSTDGVIELMPTSDGRLYGFKYVNGHPANPARGFQTVTAFGALADVSNGYPVFVAEMTLLTALRTAGPARATARANGLDLLRDVEMEVTCELGRTRMTVRQLLALAPGDVVELDRLAGAPADLLVNGTLLARGEVVVVDESFGLRITEIVTRDAT